MPSTLLVFHCVGSKKEAEMMLDSELSDDEPGTSLTFKEKQLPKKRTGSEELDEADNRNANKNEAETLGL